MKKIILTGGGTAGHVTPNIALIPGLREAGFEIEYIGSVSGIEKELIGGIGIKYFGISTGKLRRYIDIENFKDIFRVIKGMSQANKVLKQSNPNIIFSKGGFVSVPVVVAAKLNKIPVIIHESDITAGLANKISFPFATYICASFPETVEHLPKGKSILTGAPIRGQLLTGSKFEGLKFCGLNGKKPIILVMGGSLGSVKINESLRSILDKLLINYDIVHICGKGNINEKIKRNGYIQFEYLSKELPHIFACADIMVSRAGANTIYEILALKKPNLLIPLSRDASRGDQILNAKSFAKQGLSRVLFEEDLNDERLFDEINELYRTRREYIKNMENYKKSDGVTEIIELIKKLAL